MCDPLQISNRATALGLARLRPGRAVRLPLKCVTDFSQCSIRRDLRPIGKLMAKPGELPLGVVACVLPCLVGSLVQWHLAGEMTDQPGHAMCLHCGQKRI